MAVSIKHKFVSEVADGADEDRVQPSDWNDEHEVEGLGDLAALDTVDSDQIEDAAVTDGKLRNSAALSVIGRSANSSGDPGDIAASANAQMLGRLSDALGFSSVSAFLDAAFSSTRGAVLYRGASAWAALAPGDAGKVFTTNGAGADPTWETASGGGGSPIGFRAFRTSSQSFSSGNFTKVQFNNEAFDLGSHYSTSNHRWTPPAGLVLLVFAVRFQDNPNAGWEMHINKNGASYDFNNALAYRAGTVDGAVVTYVDQANGTDYYEAYLRMASSVTLDPTATQYFAGAVL